MALYVSAFEIVNVTLPSPLIMFAFFSSPLTLTDTLPVNELFVVITTTTSSPKVTSSTLIAKLGLTSAALTVKLWLVYSALYKSLSVKFITAL